MEGRSKSKYTSLLLAGLQLNLVERGVSMLFREYQKLFMDFFDEEIKREAVLSKRRYLTKERKLRRMCILDETVEQDGVITKGETIMGKPDVEIEEFLPLDQSVSNDELSKSMKLLSPKERKVVSFRYKDKLTYQEMCPLIETKRVNTAHDAVMRAMGKLAKMMKKD